MLGAASGAFWLWMAGTLTTFVRNGFERVAMLLRTGRVDRPDILIAAPAAFVTGGRSSHLINRSCGTAVPGDPIGGTLT